MSWDDDKLGRKRDAEALQTYIESILSRQTTHPDKGLIINLDAPWGSGKTFFLERLKKQLESSGYNVIYFNAWEHDYLPDPLLPLTAEITKFFDAATEQSEAAQTLRKKTGAIIRAATIGATRQAAKRLFGEALEEIENIITSGDTNASISKSVGEAGFDSAIDQHGAEDSKVFFEIAAEANRSRESFSETIAEFLSEQSTRASFLLIDELDRARPSFSVELLERIKHLISAPNLVTIFATDRDQLAAALSGVYGSEYDGEQYLRRFFDRKVTFARGDRVSHIKGRITERQVPLHAYFSPGERDGRAGNGEQDIAEAVVQELDAISTAFNLSVRDVEQTVDTFEMVSAILPGEQKRFLSALVYLLIVLQFKGKEGHFRSAAALRGGMDIEEMDRDALARVKYFGWYRGGNQRGQGGQYTLLDFLEVVLRFGEHDLNRMEGNYWNPPVKNVLEQFYGARAGKWRDRADIVEEAEAIRIGRIFK